MNNEFEVPVDWLKNFVLNTGVDEVAPIVAKLIIEKISSPEVGHQFFLEEMDAAQHGDRAARDFVERNKAAFPNFQGAMNRSNSEVDGPDGPQQLLLQITSQFREHPDVMVELRTKVVEAVRDQLGLAGDS